MKWEKIDIDKLKLNPINPRVIKGLKFKQLVKSVKDFPEMLEIRPIVVDAEMVVLGGNMRLKACIEAGFKEVPVIHADSLTEEQKKEFIIKDNLAFGEWDWDSIANDWDVDLLTEWSLDLPVFDNKELIADEDDYEIPIEINTDIIVSDLFQIGEHRLICGDSLDINHVKKLMKGNKADMVFADPPYDIKDEGYYKNIDKFTENAHVFVMHDDKGIINYLRLSNLEFNRFFVANFGFAQPRGNDPYLQHILISHEKKGNSIPHINHHDSFRSILKMEYRHRLKEDKKHDHQKPVKFIADFIKHYSKEGYIILDPFIGSGTSMVASHQLKRKCYGIEINPKFCQLTINRMLELSPNLEITKNGKKYKQNGISDRRPI